MSSQPCPYLHRSLPLWLLKGNASEDQGSLTGPQSPRLPPASTGASHPSRESSRGGCSTHRWPSTAPAHAGGKLSQPSTSFGPMVALELERLAGAVSRSTVISPLARRLPLTADLGRLGVDLMLLLTLQHDRVELLVPDVGDY